MPTTSDVASTTDQDSGRDDNDLDTVAGSTLEDPNYVLGMSRGKNDRYSNTFGRVHEASNPSESV